MSDVYNQDKKKMADNKQNRAHSLSTCSLKASQRHHNDSQCQLNREIVHKFEGLSLNAPSQIHIPAHNTPVKTDQVMKTEDDVSVNELASYLETLLTLPQPMSYMASLMYT